MTALLAALYRGAKEYNTMSDEARAARAKQIADAEAKRLEKEKRILDEDEKIRAEQRAEQQQIRTEQREKDAADQARNDTLSALARDVDKRVAVDPSKFYLINESTLDISEIQKPEKDYSLQEWTSLFTAQNSLLENTPTKNRYLPEAVSGKPGRFTAGWGAPQDASEYLYTTEQEATEGAKEIQTLMGLTDENSTVDIVGEKGGFKVTINRIAPKTAEEKATPVYTTEAEAAAGRPKAIAAAGLTEENADVKIKSVPGGFQLEVSRRPEVAETEGVVYKTEAEAAAGRPLAIAAAGLTEDTANVEVKSVKGGFELKVSPKPAKEPEKPENPYDMRHFARRDLGKDFADKTDRYETISLMSEVGDDRLYATLGTPQMAERQQGEHLVHLRRSGKQGADGATEQSTFMFTALTPDVMQKIVNNKSTNRRSFVAAQEYIVETARKLQSPQVDEQQGIAMIRPILEVEPRLAQFMALDSELEARLEDIGADPVNFQLIQGRLGNAVNLPPMQDLGTRLENDDITFEAMPNVTEAFGEDTGEMDANNRRIVKVPETFLNDTAKIAKESKMSHGIVLKLLDEAEVTDTSGPESASQAYEGMKDNRRLLKLTEPFVTLAPSGNALEFDQPQLTSGMRDQFLINLAPHKTHMNRILAVKTAIPPAPSNLAEAVAAIGGSKNPEQVYGAVKGGAVNYKHFDDRFQKAEQVVATHKQLVQLLSPVSQGGQGGPVGLPLELEKLKESATYLLDYTLKGLNTAGTSTENGFTESTVSGASILQELREELNGIGGTNAGARNALINLNIKMQAYAYASMMDPNGRLSDQDREQAEQAIVAGSPRAVLTVSSRLAERATYQMSMINAYTSGRPRDILAADLYRNIGGGTEVDVRTFIRSATGSGSEAADTTDVDANARALAEIQRRRAEAEARGETAERDAGQEF